MRRARTSLLVGMGSLILVAVWLLGSPVRSNQPRRILSTTNSPTNPPPGPSKASGVRVGTGGAGARKTSAACSTHHPRDDRQSRGISEAGQGVPLGEELHNDVIRIITPTRIGIQIIQERDGYDRTAGKTGEFDPKRGQGAASFTFMHNHTGSHLDTFSHVYRENSIYNNAPPPRPDGTVHGDAASVRSMVGRGVLLDVAKYKGTDPLPSGYWISLEDLQNTAKAQKVEIQKGDILLVRTGWRKMWDEPGPDGRADPAHTKWHQAQPGVGADCLAFFNDMETVAVGADNGGGMGVSDRPEL